jgi:glutamate/aspartate transport system permease protein
MTGFDFDVIVRVLPYLWQGLQYTFKLMGVAIVGGIVLGTLLALARLSSIKPLAMVAAGYVNLMRAIPLVLVIFWFYFMVPLVLQAITGAPAPVSVGPAMSAYITFVLFEAAYFCEIVRAGVKSVPTGQTHAAQALGLTYAQTMRFVVLPRAFRNVLPVLVTQAIVLFQDTSLVYVISVTDFLGAASKVAQRDHRLVEMYLFAGLVYLVICYAGSLLVQRMQKRNAALFAH